MANEKILLVDDDPDMLEVLELYLKKNEYTVFTASDGLGAIAVFEKQQPELIILDVMMPNLDGFELCQYIRRKSDVPIIFLSSKDDDIDKILGLGIGGDDYVMKTTSPAVLVARVKAHLRRSRVFPQENKESFHKNDSVLEFPGLIIDQNSAVVKKSGSVVKLSAKEYQLLSIMARAPGQVFGVEQLFEIVWGAQSLGDSRTVKVHLSNLRKKLETDPDNPVYIQNVRGFGYKFSRF